LSIFNDTREREHRSPARWVKVRRIYMLAGRVAVRMADGRWRRLFGDEGGISWA